MQESIYIVVTTVDREQVATAMARGAVRANLAPCAQVEPPMTSHYIWEGQLKEEKEVRVVFKTAESGLSRLMEWIRAGHPYSVPELVAWRADSSDPDYRKWVQGG